MSEFWKRNWKKIVGGAVIVGVGTLLYTVTKSSGEGFVKDIIKDITDEDFGFLTMEEAVNEFSRLKEICKNGVAMFYEGGKYAVIEL
jgi:hypothetical protein